MGQKLGSNKGYKNKQTKSCDPIRGIERSSGLYPFRLSSMLSLRMLSLAARQTHMYVDSSYS